MSNKFYIMNLYNKNRGGETSPQLLNMKQEYALKEYVSENNYGKAPLLKY